MGRTARHTRGNSDDLSGVDRTFSFFRCGTRQETNDRHDHRNQSRFRINKETTKVISGMKQNPSETRNTINQNVESLNVATTN